MAEQLVLRGTLEGHSGWVTSLATSLEKYVCTGLGLRPGDAAVELRAC
jgi:hypothetical protein